MNWSKIPTNLLTQRIPDNELVAIVKYQLLWASLEEQPNIETMQRYLTSKQIKLVKSWQDSIKELVTSDLRLIKSKRRSDKILYKKNKIKIRIGKICKMTHGVPCFSAINRF